jgi:uncharacterized protein (DUF2141 family)
MIKLFIHILLFTMFSSPVTEELSIVVRNIYPVEGKLYFALYDDKESFLEIDEASHYKIVEVNDTIQTIMFDGLEKGNYAVTIFQDLNGNGLLDKNLFGMPTEPYGFSNDARGRMGPPKFRDAVFSFSGSEKIEINLINDNQ